VGDIARELPRRVSAIERFTAAGDVRNACDQRVRAGAVVLRLGAFDEAERILHEALGIAEPMRLATSSLAKAYLAFAAFRQGEADRALSLARDALEEIQTHGDRHSEALCSSFLALIYALREEVDDALAAAQNAVACAEPFPALLSQALGVHAATLLVAGRAQLALAPAERAMDLLADNGGAGEGESLTRLTHALVLAQSGETAASRKSMKAARDRIVGLAERLSDPRYKKSFLDRISENARILQLGGEWLDEAVSTPGGTR
jgi:tetratricopeptide (TPR) repeat protein